MLSARRRSPPVGLDAFGLIEIETRNASEKPSVLRERLTSIVHYLFASGPIIRDGDTIGEDARQKIRARYGDSSFDRSESVMRLDYEIEATASGWALFGTVHDGGGERHDSETEQTADHNDAKRHAITAGTRRAFLPGRQ